MTESVRAQLAAVRTESRKTEKSTDRRNATIRAAHAAGASLREIADAADLSHMTIKRIINQKDQP